MIYNTETVSFIHSYLQHHTHHHCLKGPSQRPITPTLVNLIMLSLAISHFLSVYFYIIYFRDRIMYCLESIMLSEVTQQ